MIYSIVAIATGDKIVGSRFASGEVICTQVTWDYEHIGNHCGHVREYLLDEHDIDHHEISIHDRVNEYRQFDSIVEDGEQVAVYITLTLPRGPKWMKP